MSIHINTNFFQFLEFMVVGGCFWAQTQGLTHTGQCYASEPHPQHIMDSTSADEEPCHFPKPLLCYLVSHLCEVVANGLSYMIQKFGEERVNNTSLNLLLKQQIP